MALYRRYIVYGLVLFALSSVAIYRSAFYTLSPIFNGGEGEVVLIQHAD